MTRFERFAYIVSIAGLLSAFLVLNAQNTDLSATAVSDTPVSAGGTP